MSDSDSRCTAFSGSKQIASGELLEVARAARAVLDADDDAQVLIFDDHTSQVIEVDFRGTAEDVVQRLARTGAAPAETRSPGRPKLGVVAREVTLLPRHWDWLAMQPGGASVTLRKLVEQARHDHQDKDRLRQAQESAYRFMSAMAGNFPDFEEAARALFAGDKVRFENLIRPWPSGVREHAFKLAARCWR